MAARSHRFLRVEFFDRTFHCLPQVWFVHTWNSSLLHISNFFLFPYPHSYFWPHFFHYTKERRELLAGISCLRVVFLANINKKIEFPCRQQNTVKHEIREPFRPFSADAKIKIHKTIILFCSDTLWWSGNDKRRWSDKITPSYKT